MSVEFLFFSLPPGYSIGLSRKYRSLLDIILLRSIISVRDAVQTRSTNAPQAVVYDDSHPKGWW